jgi:hypothetical protein
VPGLSATSSLMTAPSTSTTIASTTDTRGGPDALSVFACGRQFGVRCCAA